MKTKKHSFLVEKIGGTSMSHFKEVLENIMLNKELHTHYLKKLHPPLPSFPYGRSFIVSAYGGVTNLLLENKKTNMPGVYHDFLQSKHFDKSIQKVLKKLLDINSKLQPLGLPLPEANFFIEKRVEDAMKLLDDLHRVMASGYLLKENIMLASRELLASLGESHSAFNSYLILTKRDIACQFVDLSGFQDQRPLSIERRIDEGLSQLKLENHIAIITGYVKGTEGIMREFDRGYSDITFSKIAIKIKAAEALIHKEFHLSSADPKIVGEKKAIPVGNTNYDVADQLADVGMEAIHPKASKPLEMANINLRVRNTFEPDHYGTLISRSYIGKKAKIEIITGSDKVTLVEIHDPKMVSTPGFDAKLSQLFAMHNLSYIFKSTNANSISQVFWEKHLTPKIVQKVKELYHTVTAEKVAIISVIGSNIAIPGMLSRTATVLSQSKINIKCVSQSLRQVNMQFIIDRKDYKKAIKNLHKELCEKKN